MAEVVKKRSQLEKLMEVSPDGKELSKRGGRELRHYALAWSLLLLIATPIAAIYTGEGWGVFANFYRLITSPARLITDYFALGSLGATLLNAALCGLFCNLMIRIFDAKSTSTLLAGYFLVIAHCFYGLNFLNMMPPFFGILLFLAIRKEKIGNMLHLAMFSTSLGPFISEFLFRYALGDSFVLGQPEVTWIGVVIVVIFSLAAGFLIPALLPGTTKMHRGHNLYKAGLAIGLFGVLAYAFFFKTLGIDAQATLVGDNAHYESYSRSYLHFMDVFYFFIFGGTFLLGFIQNGWSLKGYRELLKCDGWQDDFPVKFGMNLTWINIGIYGLAVLLYFNLVIFFTDGVGLTGPTAGVIIAAVTFSACGQTPKNVWPIAIGYLLIFGLSSGICAIAGLPILWSVSTQAYINGVGFATGLCPFAGRYGWKIGIIAGALSATLCTSTAAMHGGFVLYNGGFTAGLAALLLLPILDYYKVKTREEDSL